VVVFFAPLGAFVISKMKREGIAQILYTILIVQFIGAMWVIKPSLLQFLICVVILFVGVGTFGYLAVISKRRIRQSRKQKMIYMQSVSA
jgi:ABC-type bacteriocin/lantibiotic exporter with double-glycine peptidase domain